MLKKSVGMLLAVLLLLSSLPVLAESAVLSDEEALLVGSWIWFDGDVPAGTVVTKEDRTYEKLALDGTVLLTGTWSAADGVIRDGDVSAPYTLEDDVLTIAYENGPMVMTRIPVESKEEAPEEAAPEISEEMARLVGRWVFFEDGAPVGIVVLKEDGTYENVGLDGTVNATGTWSAVDGAFWDGNLKGTYTLEGIVLKLAYESITMTLTRIPE